MADNPDVEHQLAAIRANQRELLSLIKTVAKGLDFGSSPRMRPILSTIVRRVKELEARL